MENGTDGRQVNFLFINYNVLMYRNEMHPVIARNMQVNLVDREYHSNPENENEVAGFVVFSQLLFPYF